MSCAGSCDTECRLSQHEVNNRTCGRRSPSACTKRPVMPAGEMVSRGSTVRVRQRASAYLLLRGDSLVSMNTVRRFRCPPSVHERPPRERLLFGRRVERVEEPDRVLSGVAEVAVDMVRLAPMWRERSKVEMPARSAKVAKVPEIVDASRRLDGSQILCSDQQSSAPTSSLLDRAPGWGQSPPDRGAVSSVPNTGFDRRRSDGRSRRKLRRSQRPGGREND